MIVKVVSSEEDRNSLNRNEGGRAAAVQVAGNAPEKGTWIRRILPEAPIFLFYLAVAAFLTWPVAAHFTRSVYGFPSDNLGQLWVWWWYRNAHLFGAHASFSTMTGFPFGQGLPTVSAEFVVEYSARFFLLFMTPAVVYNMFITSSFLLSGVTMYYLVRHITHDRSVAFFGGFAYVISAYHAVQATYSVNLAMTQWMPLFILMLLLFMKKASLRNAALLFVAGLLVMGTSIHYGFFIGIFTIVFLIGHFAYKRLVARKYANDHPGSAVEPVVVNRKTVALVLLVILGILLVIFPLFLLSQYQIGKAGKWPTRPTTGGLRNTESAIGGAARPLNYVLPEEDNRIVGWITKRYAPNRINFYSNSLYIGFTMIVMAMFAIVLIFRRRKTCQEEDDPDEPNEKLAWESRRKDSPLDPPTDERALAWGLILATVVAFILSMPPYLKIGGTSIPLPSVILRYIVPWLRWYMRVGAVLIICIILLASLGLAWLKRRMKPGWGVALIALLTVVLFLESTLVPPFKYFTLSDKPPGVFETVATSEFTGGIVVYPAFEPGFFTAQRYLYYQTMFKKPMLNGGLDSSDGEALRRTVYNPFDPDTPRILRRMGIDHVVYLDKMFREYEGRESPEQEIKHLPPGLKLVKRVTISDPFGSGYFFEVTAPPADLVPIYQGDFTVPHLDDRATVRLMERDGIIRIVNYSGKPLTTRVIIPISNLEYKHPFALVEGDKVLLRGTLKNNDSTSIDIPSLRVPKGGTELHLVAGGREFKLDSGEGSTFGTTSATLKIGDVMFQPVAR